MFEASVTIDPEPSEESEVSLRAHCHSGRRSIRKALAVLVEALHSDWKAGTHRRQFQPSQKPTNRRSRCPDFAWNAELIALAETKGTPEVRGTERPD